MYVCMYVCTWWASVLKRPRHRGSRHLSTSHPKPDGLALLTMVGPTYQATGCEVSDRQTTADRQVAAK